MNVPGGVDRRSPTRGRLALLGVGLVAILRGRRDSRGAASRGERRPRRSAESLAVTRPATVSGIEEPPRWRSRFAFYAVGGVMIGWGLFGLLTTTSTKPPNWAAFFVGGIVAHDLVFSPLLALVVVLALHRIPAPYRSYVQAGVLVTGLLTLVTLPMALSPGRPDDPSTLPLPYPRNLLIVLAVVWLGVLLTAVLDRRLRAGRGAAVSPGRSSSSAAWPS